MTVLFADLVGSTAAQEAMDPESVRRWIDRYYAVLREQVEVHGGRVVKFIGDGMMAVFGVPDVREDDAERAITAAQAMHEAVAAIPGGPAGLAIGLRVGVNTGEVVVSTADDDVVGDAVNVAARFEQAAAPGEVIVGEATFRLVRNRAQLRALPPLVLKGKAEPVAAFRLVSLSDAREDALASPFVGRAGELERLGAVLDDVVTQRRPQLASLVGVPGVGKSRLVHELGSQAAERSAGVVVVRCDPAGGATFGPVATALRAAASLTDDAPDELVLAGLAALIDDEPERDRIVRGAAALLGVGDPALPEETFWAVRRLVESAARIRPLLFVFEDVHWAEPLLLDLIEHLATFARDVPVLLLVTARPELREQRPGLVEVGSRVTAAIHLQGLAIDESHRLTRALLDGAELPLALLDRVTAASEGNPLFVRELVRMLVDDGVLKHSDEGWQAAVDLGSVDVPISIHAVLAARIDRLPAGEQEVLGAASIMGRTFARGAVAHLVSAEVAAQLDLHLEGLRRKELVERTGSYWLDEPQLRFHHALVQDAAYRRLLKEVRAPLHAGAAAWLEEKVGDLAEHDDLIGFHLEQAHLLLVEAGTGDDGLGRRASERLRGAGRRALEADDHAGAAALLGRALACLPAGDGDRAVVLLDRCEALLAMGDVSGAADAVEDLTAAASGDPRLEAWVACYGGELANLRDPGQLAVTVQRVSAAADALVKVDDHAGVAKAHAVRAASLARLGRIGDCEHALDQALGAARRAGDRRRATAILAGAPPAALWGPNTVPRASGRCLDVVRVLRITSRAPAIEVTSLRCQAVLEALRGREDTAERMLRSARATLEELGHPLGLAELDLAAGMVATLADDLVQAEQHLRLALEGFHELGIDVDAGLAAALLARVRRRQGASAEAIELTHDSERLGGDDLRTGIAWRSVRAAALAAEGEVAEARRLADEAVALAAPTDALIDHGDALMALADVLTHAGDAEAAAVAAASAVDLYDRKEATTLAERGRRLAGPTTAGATEVEPDLVEPGKPVMTDTVPRLPELTKRAGPAPVRHLVDGGSGAIVSEVPDSGGAAEATILGWLDEAIAAVRDRDWDALSDLAPADLIYEDRRAFGAQRGPVGRGAFLAEMQALAAIGVQDHRARVLWSRGDRLLLVEMEFIGPSGGLVQLEAVELEADGRRPHRGTSFDVEDQAGAIAELERWWIAQQLADATERTPLQRATEALLPPLLEADWDAFRAGLHPEVTYHDRRPFGTQRGPVGREELVAELIGAHGIGLQRIDVAWQAIRGERRGLVRIEMSGPDAVVPFLLMTELTEQGLIGWLAIFEVADLDEALAALDERDARAEGA